MSLFNFDKINQAKTLRMMPMSIRQDDLPTFNFDCFDKAKAKGTTGGESVKLCRDIFQKPIVFNVGIQPKQGAGEGIYTLIPNTEEKIYQGCPANIFDYVFKYYEKFHTCPPAVINCTIYEEENIHFMNNKMVANTTLSPMQTYYFQQDIYNIQAGETKEVSFEGCEVIVNENNPAVFRNFYKKSENDSAIIREKISDTEWGNIQKVFYDVKNKTFGVFSSEDISSLLCTFVFIESSSENIDTYKGLNITNTTESILSVRVDADLQFPQVASFNLQLQCEWGENEIGSEENEEKLEFAEMYFYITLFFDSGYMSGNVLFYEQMGEKTSSTETVSTRAFSTQDIAPDPSLNITQD